MTEAGYAAMKVSLDGAGVLLVRRDRPEALSAFDATMKQDFWALAEKMSQSIPREAESRVPRALTGGG